MPADLALVLPCYNPPEGWAANVLGSLQRLRPMLPPTLRLHLYVVNDGSPQGVTEADIALLRGALPTEFSYLHYPVNRGKGYALRVGVQQVHEPLCVFTDIDFPYTEASVAAVVEALFTQQCDLAVGIRDESYYAQVPAARRRVSKLLRSFTRTLLRLPTDDTQCGLKGFNQAGRELFLQTTTDRYLFDLELLLLAGRRPSLRTRTIPVTLKPETVLSPLNTRILLTESRNLARLLFR